MPSAQHGTTGERLYCHALRGSRCYVRTMDVREERIAVIPVMAQSSVLDWWIQAGEKVDNIVYGEFLEQCVVSSACARICRAVAD